MTKKEARKHNEKLKMVLGLKEKGVPLSSAKRLAGLELVKLRMSA